MPGHSDERRIDAIVTVLASCAWRRQTLEMIARRILAALDSHHVVQGLGLRAAAAAPSPEPVDPGDERIAIVEEALRRCSWRALTGTGVARQALVALDAWWLRRSWDEIEVAWRMDSYER